MTAPTYDKLLDALAEMVALHCENYNESRTLNSSCVSVHANALRVLAAAGRVDLLTDRGRAVTARWTKKAGDGK